MKVYTAENLTNEEIVAVGDDPDSSLQTRAWCCQAMSLAREQEGGGGAASEGQASSRRDTQRARARSKV